LIEMTRDSYHHGQLRQALIDAALALEPEQGALGTSLREVARRARVSHPAVYHHFPSKEALVVAVAEQGFDRLIDTLERPSAWARAGDPILDLVALGHAYVRFAHAEPSRFRFMFGLPASGEPALASRQDDVLNRFASAVARAQDAGLLVRGNARRFGAQLWSVAHGAAALSVSDALDGVPRGRADKETPGARARRAKDLVQQAVVAWVMGVLTPGSRWGRRRDTGGDGESTLR
jgi:AcrR family transcriptional regulator